ncbi:MAG: hypothetical protein ACOX0F_10815 [Syntrophomonadaceae bacterium]
MSNPNKIIVEILAGTRGMGGACAGCVSGSCCGTEDYEALTEKVAKELQDEYSDRVEIRYVDVDQVGLGPYPKVRNVLTIGYKYPITVIDGKPRLAGGVSLEQIKEIVEETINQPPV